MPQSLGTVADLITALAMVVSCWLMARAMNKRTDVKLTNQPVKVEVDEAIHRQFSSKEEFDLHVQNNNQDARDIWKEINELKKENLALTKAIGEMSSRILADLANAQKLAPR